MLFLPDKPYGMANNLLSSIVRPLLSCYDESEARAIARYVAEVRFGLTQTDICMGKDTQIPAEERSDLENIIGRLLRKEPVQYVLGQADFFGRTFRVAPGVLIPRPETEELVQWVLAEQVPDTPPHILDIGTGSGCIAVTLAEELPRAEVHALDISPQALEIARKNAAEHRVRVAFHRADILHGDVPESIRTGLDVVASNPPYICRSEAREMDDNVLGHEPPQALFVPDEEPLLFYEAIGRFAIQALRPGGRLYVEINRRFGRETAELFRRTGFKDIELRKDLCGNDRMVRCRK